MKKRTEVAIVGGGVAGLACARELKRAGRSVLVIEGEERVGGRLKTDAVDGYLFDRGFQVLQLAYPAVREMLDVDALDMRRYPAGTRIWADDRFHLLADPRRGWRFLLPTIAAGIGTVVDRLRLIRLAAQVSRSSVEEIFAAPEEHCRDYLHRYGFSEAMIKRFFVPFMAGICLDPEIRVSSRFLLFVMKMFAAGDVAVPAMGMEAIPRQLADGLAEEEILCNSRVLGFTENSLEIEGGGVIGCEAIVLATAEPQTAELLGTPRITRSCGESCLYFSTDEAPVAEPLLILNGSGRGAVNSVNFPSMVAPDCAPAGKILISVVVPGRAGAGGEKELVAAVRREVGAMFGPGVVEGWELLRIYHIDHALPLAMVPTANPFTADPHLGGNRFIAGEFGAPPSTQWALYGGKKAGEAVDRYLG